MRPQVLALHPGRGSSDIVAKAWVGPVQRWLSRRRHETLEEPAVKGLRRRTPRDVGACIRLLRVVHYESHYPVHWPESPRRWLTEGSIDAWVVVREGEILGHVALSPVGVGAASRLRWREMTGHDPADLVDVTRLFVRPIARGQGIGSALLDVAAHEGRSRGLLPVLEVVSPSREKIGLLNDRGWRLLAVDPWKDGPGFRVHCYAAPPVAL